MIRTTRDDVQHIKGHFGQQIEQQSYELQLIRKQLQALAQARKSNTPKRQPLRDTVYNWIIHTVSGV